MVTYVNLQAWLDTNSAAHPPIVTPYVRSAVNQRIQYKIHAVKSGHSGTSQVDQGGSVMAKAGQPTALSQFSISVDQGDECSIELMLTPDDASSSHYRFDCPR
jgi:hypothetical protein